MEVSPRRRRYLQTLLELGEDQNSTVVFPLPMEVIMPLTDAADRLFGRGGAPPDPPD